MILKQNAIDIANAFDLWNLWKGSGGGGESSGEKKTNYVFMSFKENIYDTVFTSNGTEPIPFSNIELNGLTVENNKVKLKEGHKYFVIASTQNPTAYYINICNKDGIYTTNGSDGNYQAVTISCIYVAKQNDVIYLGVNSNNSGSSTIRRNSTFIVIELP